MISDEGADPTTTVAGRSTTTSRKGGAPATVAPRPGAVSACGKAVYLPDSNTEVPDRAPGLWLACDASSPVGTNEVGLELRNDFTFSKLVRAGDGSLQRLQDWGGAGNWGTTLPGRSQIFLDVYGMSSGYETKAFFADDNRAMRIEDLATGRHGSYLRAPEGTVLTDAPRRQGPDDCARGEGREQHFAVRDELATAAAHAWRLCAAPSAFGTEEAGIEIRPDGTWSKLRVGPNGSLERMAGPGDVGTWEAAHAQRLDFTSSGGIHIKYPTFATDSPKMRLDDYGEGGADYVRLPPGTTITG